MTFEEWYREHCRDWGANSRMEVARAAWTAGRIAMLEEMATIRAFGDGTMPPKPAGEQT